MNREALIRRLSLSLMIVGAALGPARSSYAGPTLQFGAPHIATGAFSRPYGLGIDDTHGRLLVADTGNNRIKWVAIADIAGAYAFAEHGYVAAPSDPAALADPMGIAADAAGNLYVVSTLEGVVQFYPFSSGSYGPAQTFCSTNPHNVAGVNMELPRDIAIAPDGSVYLLDSGNNRILKATGPTDTDWEVYLQGSSWSNPYGLTVDSTGAVYLADTGNHRILKIESGAVTATYGSFGRSNGQFRYPRDVAVDSYGRLFVADTYNHRIVVLASDGHHLVSLGHPPSISTIEKIAVDAEGRIFVVDSDNDHLLAFLGASVPAPFDPYFRDFLGDPGDEPSDPFYLLSSPDLLVRHAPDVDLAAASAAGLETIAFQQPRYNETNYVYVALHNRGTQPAGDNFAKVYWYDPASAGLFPDDWSDTGFYSAFSDETHNTPGNALFIPLVPPGGTVVAGPLLWRPPAPDILMMGDGLIRLGLRVTNPYDYAIVGSVTAVRDSNNAAERPAQVLRGPFTSGPQNTLMVRVHFPDLTDIVPDTTTLLRAEELAAWIEQVSWGEAIVTVVQKGPITAPHDRTYYAAGSNTLLVELTQDVIDILTAAEPGVLDGTAPGEEIGRIVLVTNDLAYTRDWATTGTWPYTVTGETRYLSVSVQGGNNAAPLFQHGMSHQLGLVDLYAHENATFPRPYADGWDNMATPMTGVHPLVWSKELAYWVTAHGSRILFVPRPPPGGTWNNGGNPIPLHYQLTAGPDEIVGVAFGLTNGITSFTDETAFYYVEARRNSGLDVGADSALPGTGVLMYYANIQIPQGQGPVILRDHVPGGDLTDAPIPLGGTQAPAGTGIQVVVQAGTGGADYNLAVQYNPPIDYDVYMHAGDPSWASPDIWPDSQIGGYASPPTDTGELAVAGEENRVYARVFNHGPATAYDVEVAFFFSEPYHTVGDEGAFDEFKAVFIDEIPSGEDRTAYVTWTPATGVNPHTCALVKLRRLFNDTNAANDGAQRNLEIDHSVHGSPYTPVVFPFQVRNEESFSQLIYFRVDDVPDGWTWSVSPPKVLVDPGQTATAQLSMQPLEATPDCTSHKIFVTGWTPRGDTLIRLGGTTVRVDLQQKTAIKVALRVVPCDREDYAGPKNGTPQPGPTDFTHALFDSAPHAKMTLEDYAGGPRPKPSPDKCARLVAMGCTDPKQPFAEITLRYEGLDGEPIYHTVTTDANGCFEDFNVVVEGGAWQAGAEFPGGDCPGPATAVTTIDVPLPQIDHSESQQPASESRVCVLGQSLDAEGEIESSEPEAAKARDCRSASIEQNVLLHVKSNGTVRADLDLAGEIRFRNLRHILALGKLPAGLHHGRFEWRSADGSIVLGKVEGLTDVGTHRDPLVAGSREKSHEPRHWELSMTGTVVRGKRAGARMRAVALLDVIGDRTGPIGPGDLLTGTVEVVLEDECLLSREDREARIEAARREAERPPLGACGPVLPCLRPFDKVGKGEIELNQTGKDRCDESDCRSEKTWSSLEARLQSVGSVEGANSLLGDASIRIPELVQILDSAAERGVHGGFFELRDGRGNRVLGEILGLSNAGTHRRPAARGLESSLIPGHLEGKLEGIVVEGPATGHRIEGRYVMRLGEGKGRRRPVVVIVTGWGYADCLERPHAARQNSDDSPHPTPQPPRRLEPTLSDERFRPLKALPKEAVEALREKRGGPLTASDQRFLRIVDRVFRDLDKQRDGALDRNEFAVLGKAAEAKPAQTPLRRRAAESDADVVSLTPPEGKEAPRDAPVADEEIFRLLDTDGDGKLTRQERRKLDERLFERLFSKADKNADGRIDFTEFALWQDGLPRVSTR